MTTHEHAKVHQFLKDHPMGVLSTVAENGQPWGSAIYFIADEDFNIYFVTRTGTFKYQNLGAEPHVALTIADAATQTTIQIAGVVSQLQLEQYGDVLDKLAALRPGNATDWVPPLAKVHAGDYMPLKLMPTKMQYADYGQAKPEVGADYIERII